MNRLLAAFVLTGTATFSPALSFAAGGQLSSPQPVLSATQVDGLLLAIDAADHDIAKLADDSTHEVRLAGYAFDLEREATELKADIDAALAQDGGVPQASPESLAVEARLVRDSQLLGAAYGSAFTHAFLGQQVDAQTAYLELIDQRLVPATSAPARQQLVARLRATTERALVFAKQLRADLDR